MTETRKPTERCQRHGAYHNCPKAPRVVTHAADCHISKPACGYCTCGAVTVKGAGCVCVPSRVVAECWTCCGHTQHDESNITCQYKHTVPRLLSLGASAVCRAAGHKVVDIAPPKE